MYIMFVGFSDCEARCSAAQGALMMSAESVGERAQRTSRRSVNLSKGSLFALSHALKQADQAVNTHRKAQEELVRNSPSSTSRDITSSLLSTDTSMMFDCLELLSDTSGKGKRQVSNKPSRSVGSF